MAKRIKSINGYTIYQLTERDVNNEFYNATPGNYVIYLSSDIREYGRTNSTPEFEDIETLNECFEICDGVTATAMDIINLSEYEETIENIEMIEYILNVARENDGYLVAFTYVDEYDNGSIICVRYDHELLQSVLADFRENNELIINISIRDENGVLVEF